MMRKLLTLLTAPLLLAGCIGIHDNTPIFLNPPREGMSEGALIRNYGTPSFAGFAENEKIYTYKVRNNKYIVLVGIYEGYDLVITCKNGTVTAVDRVIRPKTFALFQPLPWAETD
jgi:hypothetical protein